MAKRKAFFILWLAAVSSVCWCFGEEAMGQAKEAAQMAADNVKAKAEDAVQDAKETSDSWSDWAMTKITDGLNVDKDEVKDAAQTTVDKAKDAASMTIDGASNMVHLDRSVLEGAGEAMNKASNMAYGAKESGKDRAYDAYAYASDKAGAAMNRASEMAGQAREEGIDKMYAAYDLASDKTKQAVNLDAIRRAKLSAFEAYGTASSKAGQAMDTASSMASNAKETLKDKADQTIKMATTDKAKQAVNPDAIRLAKMSAFDAYGTASSKAGQAMDTAWNMASNAKDRGKDMASDVKGRMDYGKDEAFESYEEAKRVHDAYELAKKSMAEQAKAKYESAKEKASEVTGNLGAKLKTGASSEL